MYPKIFLLLYEILKGTIFIKAINTLDIITFTEDKYMNYSIFLQLKIKEDKLMTMGGKHVISWDTRDIISASSGWFIINQDRTRLASELIPMLQKGILELTQDPQAYEIYEILHGLGTNKSILRFYKNLLEDCKQYPYAELHGCISA